MAIIGQLIETNINGKTEYEGHIRTLNIQIPIRLIENPHKASQGAPDYRVISKSGGQDIEVGSAWRNTSSPKIIGDESTEYLSINIDDPSMPNALNVAAFRSQETDTWNIVWSRPKSKPAENAA